MSTTPVFSVHYPRAFPCVGNREHHPVWLKSWANVCCWHGHHHIKDCNASDTQKTQNFPGLGVRKWQSLPCWPKCECASVYWKHPPQFLPCPCYLLTPMVYNLKISLLQRETAPTEWLKLPPWFSCVQEPCLFVQLFIINTLSFWILCQSESPVHPTSACLHINPCVYLFIVPLLLQLGQFPEFVQGLSIHMFGTPFRADGTTLFGSLWQKGLRGEVIKRFICLG